VGSEKFAYKLVWMDRLKIQIASWLKDDGPTLAGGDFNGVTEGIDCHSVRGCRTSCFNLNRDLAGLAVYQSSYFSNDFSLVLKLISAGLPPDRSNHFSKSCILTS
jgi:exonuclease III